MANRNFPQSKQWGFHVMPVIIDLQASIGASGAVTGLSNSPGVTSVARTAAGKYTITLQDPYNSMCSLSGMMQKASGTSGIATIELVAVSVGQTTSSPATIQIQTLDVTGAAADPASGSVITLAIRMNNSSVQ